MAAGREIYHESLGSKIHAEEFHPTLPCYFRTYTPHDLAYQGHWLWTGVVDEDGNRYACLREWKTEYSMNALISKLDSDPEKYASRLYKQLNMGVIHFEKDDEQKVIHVAPAFVKDAFHIAIQPQKIQWKDADGELELEFNALGPALKYLCPGEKENCFYTSEFCRVSGTIQGKKVKGFGGLDCSFGTPGIGWLQSKIYCILEKYWVVWANRYDDDSLEYGICFDGEADFNVGFIVRDGAAKISDCSIRMENFDDGFPGSAGVVMGDEKYLFKTRSRVSRIKGLMQWAHGEMKREGDDKKIVESFSWIEFFG